MVTSFSVQAKAKDLNLATVEAAIIDDENRGKDVGCEDNQALVECPIVGGHSVVNQSVR